MATHLPRVMRSRHPRVVTVPAYFVPGARARLEAGKYSAPTQGGDPQARMRTLRDRGLTLKRGTTTVDILINGNFQANRLAWDGAATFSRRARGGGLCVVAFSNRSHDPRHSARPANLSSIVYISRFHRASRSCTPITVPTTSTADFRPTRTARTRGCSRPDRFRGTTRPWRTRRPAWSAWRHRTGRTHRRHGYHRICGTTRRDGSDRIHWFDRQPRRTRTARADRTHRTQRSAGSNRIHWRHRCGGLYRIQRSTRSNRTHRRHRCHRICRAARTPWRYGRDRIRGTNRIAGHPRIRRTNRTQRRNRHGKPRTSRSQGRNRRSWPVGLGWPGRHDRGCRSVWP